MECFCGLCFNERMTCQHGGSSMIYFVLRSGISLTGFGALSAHLDGGLTLGLGGLGCAKETSYPTGSLQSGRLKRSKLCSLKLRKLRAFAPQVLAPLEYPPPIRAFPLQLFP